MSFLENLENLLVFCPKRIPGSPDGCHVSGMAIRVADQEELNKPRFELSIGSVKLNFGSDETVANFRTSDNNMEQILMHDLIFFFFKELL